MGPNAPKIDTPKKLSQLHDSFRAARNALSYTQIDTNTAAFETVNGESILTFYNPNCSFIYGVNGADGVQNLVQPTICANFIYDLNGRKGPNKVGKDIGFMTAFYPTDSEVATPMPAGSLTVYKDNAHPTFSVGFGNASCRTKYGNDAKMANIEELKSILIDKNLGYINDNIGSGGQYFLVYDDYISSTTASTTTVYSLRAYTGAVVTEEISYRDGFYGYQRLFCVNK